MEKFSLFDLLIFILPGAVGLQLLLWLLGRSGVAIGDVVMIDSDVMATIILVFVVYVLGSILNSVRGRMKWSWARGEDTFIRPLQKMQVWWAVLDRAAILYLDEPLKKDGSIRREVADRLFDLSFELMDQESRIDRTLSIRLQCFFLENTKLLFLISGALWALILGGNALNLHGAFWNAVPVRMDIVGVGFCFCIALCCHLIAIDRWAVYYRSFWQNSYAYHNHLFIQKIKNNEG